MREFLGFVLFLVIVFFVVGETVGWNVGTLSQTPVFVYKRDGRAAAERDTIRRNDMPLKVSGRVRDGEVEVVIVYQDTGSFQTNRPPQPPETLLHETFVRGQTIAIDDIYDEGPGRYTVELRFRNASGTFTARFPQGVDL